MILHTNLPKVRISPGILSWKLGRTRYFGWQLLQVFKEPRGFYAENYARIRIRGQILQSPRSGPPRDKFKFNFEERNVFLSTYFRFCGSVPDRRIGRTGIRTLPHVDPNPDLEMVNPNPNPDVLLKHIYNSIFSYWMGFQIIIFL